MHTELCRFFFFFFFSSRRRHTRFDCDWSSDVCSSDLGRASAQRGIKEKLGPTQAIVQRSSRADSRSEEHTSELQSQSNLVCRLLLEKKKQKHPCTASGARAALRDSETLSSHAACSIHA